MKDETEAALAAALEHFTERLGWLSATRPSDEAEALEKIRLMLHEWDSTVAPAISQIRDPQILQQLQGLLPGISSMRARARLAFCSQLRLVLQTRLNSLLWEEALGTVGRMKKLEPEAAPETIQILQTAASDLIGRPYEPETFFRAAMENADRSQNRWLELFAELGRTWPDEFTPEAESRLQAADVQASLDWIEELQMEIDSIQRDHPALVDE
jgi:hypothetical protein